MEAGYRFLIFSQHYISCYEELQNSISSKYVHAGRNLTAYSWTDGHGKTPTPLHYNKFLINNLHEIYFFQGSYQRNLNEIQKPRENCWYSWTGDVEVLFNITEMPLNRCLLIYLYTYSEEIQIL
jgi:hypothetical protein